MSLGRHYLPAVLLCSTAAAYPAAAIAAAQSSNDPGENQKRGSASAPAKDASASKSITEQSGEIIVTAQRRPERLQDVPISASVVTGADLQRKNTTTLQQLTAETPAVVVTNSGAANRLSIRGIGSGDNNPLFEQSVATFIDGIYQGRSRSSDATFLDVARVEILKGPQSVYFGNNSIAGVLNIVSRDPGNVLDGYVRGSYNFSLNSGTVEGAVGGPVSDTLGIRVAGITTRGNGYVRDNGIGGLRIPQTRSYAGRITARWHPTSDLTWTLKADGEHSREVGALADEIIDCPPAPVFTSGATGSCLAALKLGEDVVLNQRRSMSPGQRIDLDDQSYVSTIDYKTGPLNLTLISGYAHTKYNQHLDTDGTSAVLTHFTTPERYSQFSQELRLASPHEKPLSFDAGLYYEFERIHGRVDYNFTSVNPKLTGPFAPLAPYGAFGQFDDYQQHSKTYAGYLFFTVRPIHAVTISFGGRQSWVDKSLVLNQGFGIAASPWGTVSPYPTSQLQALANKFGTAAKLGVVGTRTGSRSDHHFSPSVVVSYEPSPTLNVYAKYVNGFKAGGFNALEHTGAAGGLSFGPEYVDGYEAGIKSQWFHRRLTLNLAIFRNDFSDLQVSVSQNFGSGVLNVIGNAAGARAEGVEAEGRLKITPYLSTGLSFTYLDSHYTDYPNAGGSALDVQLGHPFVDLSGAPTRYAPKYSGNYDLDYSAPVSRSLNLHLAGNVYFSSSYNFSNSNDPFLVQKGYATIGAIIGLSDALDRWQISLVGKNLTNRIIKVFGTNLAQARGSYLVSTQEPRNIAIQGMVHF